MTHIFQLFLWGWLLNPFNIILLMAAHGQLCAVRRSVGERHMLSYNDHGLVLIAWLGVVVAAIFAMRINRGGMLEPVSLAFGMLVLLHGLSMLWHWDRDIKTVVYSHVRIGGQLAYGMVILVAGGVTTRL